MVDRKEMKRIEKVRESFIKGQRFDYRCSVCNSIMEIVEFIYGNITVVKVKACKECRTLFGIKCYSDGFDKGYEDGQDDR